MTGFSFDLQAEAANSWARAGVVHTLHGPVETPVFMPVGTQATVKGLRFEELKTAGARVLLANTYHLLLRPGMEVFQKMGGIHKLMNWDRAVLTDSGGFQIFSLTHARRMREEGAAFASYVDGRKILLSPELSIQMQMAIGSDIMMVLDQCIPSTADKTEAAAAMHLTHRWAKRSLLARGDSPQALFGIVQGALHRDLRYESAQTLIDMDFNGYAIGGLAVGETKDEREEFTEFSAALLPKHKPRYLMGVGTPIDLLEAVHRGVDMFDCIIPAALSQQGVAYTSKGRLRLGRGVYKFADEALDPDCSCMTCTTYSKAYLHHLHKCQEPLGWSLTSLHNLHFYHRLMREMREAIFADRFAALYRERKEVLVLQDEEFPATPQHHRPRKQRKEELGAFDLHQSTSGFYGIRHKASGEVMHPHQDPNAEARLLYVDQSQLLERLQSADKELVLWDVGLGAAHNAMAAVRAYEEYLKTNSWDPEVGPTALKIVSFEIDLDAVRLALLHLDKFPHLKHPGAHVLLRDGVWHAREGNLQWQLFEGDFLQEIHKADRPDVIYFDPFSYKTDQDLWTEQTFAKIFEHCGDHDVEWFNYTAATRVRAALLASGFYVAKGMGTGPKSETTIALTTRAMERLRSNGYVHRTLLDRAWLERWERSDVQAPAGVDAKTREDFLQKIRGHKQFS